VPPQLKNSTLTALARNHWHTAADEDGETKDEGEFPENLCNNSEQKTAYLPRKQHVEF
jgi:1,6-anhydro-N-acetylmuramate kinase